AFFRVRTLAVSTVRLLALSRLLTLAFVPARPEDLRRLILAARAIRHLARLDRARREAPIESATLDVVGDSHVLERLADAAIGVAAHEASLRHIGVCAALTGCESIDDRQLGQVEAVARLEHATVEHEHATAVALAPHQSAEALAELRESARK